MTTATLPRKAGQYSCSECGWRTAKWAGRCAECHTWGSVAVTEAPPGPRTRAARTVDAARPIGSIDPTESAARPTGLSEVDRVLGTGLVPGSVVLVAGEPGVGKSTLLLDIAARAARQPGGKALYVSAEESAAQVRLRAERIGALADRLYLAAESDLSLVLGAIEAERPDLVVVDSAQTVVSGEVEGAAGSVTQVKEVAGALIAAAKRLAVPIVLVGHVTKDGAVAGPRTLEHLVDVVCQFEGERHTRLRVLRASKNRFGPTDEAGCFELTGSGIAEVADPSALFVSRTSGAAGAVSGRCLTITLEGKRPMAVEIQALLAPSKASLPRRATAGLDSSRLSMVLAVLQRRAAAKVQENEVYVSTVGGVRVTEPACDLATALACASSLIDTALPADLVAIGEIGLAGEIRPVAGLERRLTEAARLGHRRAIVPAGALTGPPPAGMRVDEVELLTDAVALGLGTTQLGGGATEPGDTP